MLHWQRVGSVRFLGPEPFSSGLDPGAFACEQRGLLAGQVPVSWRGMAAAQSILTFAAKSDFTLAGKIGLAE